MKRPIAGALIRLVVAAVLIAYTLWRSDPREVWRVTAGTALVPLLAAVALVPVDRALMAWRWFALLRPIEREALPSFGTIVRIFFVSTFLGTLLPASIGGDAVRAYSLSRHRVGAGDSVASVFLDRMLGVLSLLLMALAGLALVRDLSTSREIVIALGVTACGCAVTGCLIFSPRAENLAARLLAFMPWSRGRQLGEAVVGATRKYSAHHGALALVLVASLGVQALRIVQAYYLGMAVDVNQPLSTYFALVPLILLIMLLPITVNGIGTSQAAFVWLFGRIGTPNPSAFALSVLFVALGIVGNLPGAVLCTWRRSPHATIGAGLPSIVKDDRR